MGQIQHAGFLGNWNYGVHFSNTHQYIKSNSYKCWKWLLDGILHVMEQEFVSLNGHIKTHWISRNNDTVTQCPDTIKS